MSAEIFNAFKARCIAPFEAGLPVDMAQLVEPTAKPDAESTRAQDNLAYDPDGAFALGHGTFGDDQREAIMVALDDPEDACGAAFTDWVRTATKSKRYGRWTGQAKGVSALYSLDWRTPVMVCASHAPSRTGGPREFYLYDTPYAPPYPRVGT